MSAATSIEINLTAAIVTVDDEEPQVLVTRPAGRAASGQGGLPSGPFDPRQHRTFETGLRTWVREQSALEVGYVEQLYTFGDRGRHMHVGDAGPHIVSVGYLALTRRPAGPESAAEGAAFAGWYTHFPWEDWRGGRPPVVDIIMPLLNGWAAETPPSGPLGRRARLLHAFGSGSWDEEKVLDRYELMYEAGLVEEARRDGREAALAREEPSLLGRAMRFDHRRILATAMGRLRAKLKYRPVIFELMDEAFTLTELQRKVEAISGRHLHKQNFRRLVDAGALVEPTGGLSSATGGRPAQLFRFRRDVVADRPSAGLRFGGRG
jgi:hypothetical protein